MTSFNFADTVRFDSAGSRTRRTLPLSRPGGIAWEVLVKSFGLRKQYHNIRQKTVYFYN